MEFNDMRIVIVRHGDFLYGQCLEYDIGAQGKDVSTILEGLRITFDLEREISIKKHGTPFKGVGPAPKFFHDKWENDQIKFWPERDRKKDSEKMLMNFPMALCV